MADLPRRRPLLGKKLLVVAGMSAVTQFSCGSQAVVANLVAPPEDAGVVTDVAPDRADVTDVVTPQDDGVTMRDVPVANLIPPPDVVQPADVTDVPAPQDDGVTMRDVPVANLIPPPDVVQPADVTDVPQDNGITLRDVPVANLIPPPPDASR